jgi:uncharacterized protein YbbC (DUF1343 family)
MDPVSDTYVILLSNAIHPRGNPPISPLRGEVATAAAKAFLLDKPWVSSDGAVLHRPGKSDIISTLAEKPPVPGPLVPEMNGAPNVDCNAPNTFCDPTKLPRAVRSGIDVLEATNFAALKEAATRNGGHLRIGLLTNQTGLDAQGRRTIDVLRGIGNGIELVTLFSPEHGLFGAKDSTNIGAEIDPASGLKVISLYGPTDADRRPKPEDLKNLDAVVIDLQDAGVRFYTYEAVLGYFLEASACQKFHGSEFTVIVLDRPDPLGGDEVQGAVSDYAANSYINYMPLPLRHGMTLGELAKYFVLKRASCAVDTAPSMQPASVATQEPSQAASLKRQMSDKEKTGEQRTLTFDQVAHLTVVPMQNWRREEFFDATGVPWVNPSPNLRSVTEATLYPGLGMMDATNVSVGRGTATPFEVFGAGVTAATKDAPAIPAWFDGKDLVSYLTERNIPGVTFAATIFTVAEDANRYPYHGQTIQGVRLTVTDRVALDSPELGIEILSALHRLYPTQFKLEKAAPLVANSETMAALARGDDPRTIAAGWASALADFRARRQKYLLYP